jgi:nitrate reductase beta subunit
LLYDVDAIENAAKASNDELLDSQLDIIKDPFDEEVIQAAEASGFSSKQIEFAQKSPVFRFVKEWRLGLPLHPEYRTLPMLFYVPPLLPVLGLVKNGIYEIIDADNEATMPLITSLQKARMPIRFLANLFTAGNDEHVMRVYRKLIAVRLYQQAKRFKKAAEKHIDVLNAVLEEANITAKDIDDIWRLTSKATFQERFVLPPMAREMAIEATLDPYDHKDEGGFGFRQAPSRKW